MNARDADSKELILRTAGRLKAMKEFAPPAWAKFVKTGAGKERTPTNIDWWFVRAASMLRKIYLKPVGVARLKTIYGTSKKRGTAPKRHYKASGSIIRKVLKQLEAAGFVKIDEKKKGRVITPNGQKFLDSVSKELKK
ncbi:MAG: 30S ribosomal protein S19e [Candidatus Aenigmatarchaeota archaeon]